MKINIAVLAVVLTFGATLLNPELARPQSAKKPASVVSLLDLKNQLMMLKTDISATVNSLNTVKESSKKEADLAKAVDELGTRFKSLEDRIGEVRTNAITVKARVKDHYDAWAKELTEMQNASL